MFITTCTTVMDHNGIAFTSKRKTEQKTISRILKNTTVQ